MKKTLLIIENDFTIEEALRKRQEEHLKRIQKLYEGNWTPCAHDACTSCHGTGIKSDGTGCIHFISCRCPKCAHR